MPRMADQHLQKRILAAAQRLWRAHGEKGLTLRGVARQAGTTTTTVYKRFRSKEALLQALAERVNEQLIRQVTSASSLEEATQRYLDFAEKHPQEYKLLFGKTWTSVFAPGRARPVQDWTQAQLAAQFGGRASDYAQTHFALFLAMHGAASLLTETGGRARSAVRASCDRVCATMIKNIGIFRKLAAADAGRR